MDKETRERLGIGKKKPLPGVAPIPEVPSPIITTPAPTTGPLPVLKPKTVPAAKGPAQQAPNPNSRRQKQLKAQRRRIPPYGFRWPVGTIVVKHWDGELWRITVQIPDLETLLAVTDRSSYTGEAAAAFEYLAKSGKPV